MCEHFNVVKKQGHHQRSEETPKIESFHFSRIISVTTRIINALILHFLAKQFRDSIMLM